MVFPFGFPAGAPANAAYDIERSLLCDGASYLSWTPGSAGNRKTWTFSCWVKRGNLGAYGAIISSATSGTNADLSALRFSDTDKIEFFAANGTILAVTSAVFRDPSAWYHVLAALNTTGVANGFNLYVNGLQQSLAYTSFASDIEPSVNNAVPSNIGAQLDLASGRVFHFGGYMAEVDFIDGQALTPDDFGQPHPTVPQFWIPKKYTGSYGTNGFYLPFSNQANTTTLGEDASGNGNDWTLSGFTTGDSVTDTPTNNFCTWNPLDTDGRAITLSEGNLKVRVPSTVTSSDMRGTIAVDSGKFVFEATVGAVGGSIGNWVGVRSTGEYSLSQYATVYWNNGVYQRFVDGVSTSTSTSAQTGDLLHLEYDFDAEVFSVSVNGTWLWQDQAFTRHGAMAPTILVTRNDSTDTGAELNFGQKPFAYTPPAGFLALSTANLDNPGEASPLAGSFTGNASVDGPFVWLGYPPDTANTCTINGNAIAWSTHADALANGFKLRTSSSSYNAAGLNSYSIAIDEDASFADNANAQGN